MIGREKGNVPSDRKLFFQSISDGIALPSFSIAREATHYVHSGRSEDAGHGTCVKELPPKWRQREKCNTSFML
jgi:hypothetical protein